MAHKNGTKSGGRKAGTPNRATSARHDAMARVNEALAAMGDDALTGTKLLREVLRHAETPLDVKIQCAGLVLKQESPTSEQKECVVHMPPALPGDTPQAQLAIGWALYGGMGDMPAGADPEWDNAV